MDQNGLLVRLSWGCSMWGQDLQLPPPPRLLNLLASLSSPFSGGLGPAEGGPWLSRLCCGPGLSEEKCRKLPSPLCLAGSCADFKTHPGHSCATTTPGLSPSSCSQRVHDPQVSVLTLLSCSCMLVFWRRLLCEQGLYLSLCAQNLAQSRCFKKTSSRARGRRCCEK